MSQSGQALLTSSKLTVGYNEDNPLLINLDLDLQPGQLVCFMGPNGVGKSTLIRTLAGLQKPLSGTISKLDEKSVSVVLTDRVSGANMSVYELVSYGRYPYLDWNIRLRTEDKMMIDRSLEQVQITHLSNKKLFELSDGQMQMAMIARALAQDTALLILDEPTAHLDLNNRVEIMSLLSKLSRTTGKSMLVATHELDLALQTADSIWLATLSKEIKSGIPEDLVLDGSFDEVFQFKGFNLKTGKINFIPHRGVALKLSGDGHEFLWTRNSLERSGFEISDSGVLEIIIRKDNTPKWSIGKATFNSIGELLEELKKITKREPE